uniref:BACK domain-containing protein n=1 Tax=Ditylenchus dipsaci TaxID=166011 RepID=A0A915DGW0_9BILA
MMKLHQNDSTKDWILLSKDGKQRIEVHSPVILDKWTSPGKAKKDATSISAKLKVVQTTVSAHLLPAIVDYCYGIGFHGRGAQLVEEHESLVIVQLVSLANSLDLDGLVNEIFDFLVERISPESSIRLWQLCKKYNIEKYMEKVFDYLLYNLVAKFSHSLCIDWLQLSHEEVTQILKDVNLNVHSENEVLYLAKLWMDDDSRRLRQIPNVCSLLHFSSEKQVEQFKRREFFFPLAELNNMDFTIGQKNRIFRDLIVIIGGSDAALQERKEFTVYNPCSNRWQKCEFLSMSQPVSHHAVVELNKDIYVIGGLHNREHTNAVKKLNMKTGEWTTVSSMYDKRSKLCAVAFNGQIYVMGGANREGALSSAEKYDPKTNQWTYLASMTKPRSNAAAIACNGKIYVTGGVNSMMKVMDSVEVLRKNKKKDVHRWITLHNTMTVPRQGHSIICWNNDMLIAGGRNNHGISMDSVEIFGENITWNKCIMPAMNSARTDFAMISYRGEVFAIAGSRVGRSPLNSVEKFDGKNWTQEQLFWDKRAGHAVCLGLDCSQLLI